MVVELGVRYPLHSGASSRAILAHLPPASVDAAVAQLAVIHPEIDEAGYRERLTQVRQNGYAVSLNERQTGAASIAAPFFDAAGNVLGSISCCGPVFRFGTHESEDQAQKVAAAARAITSLLGR